jgi:phosphatidylglycerophosphate synthase
LVWLAHILTLSRLPIAIALTQTFGHPAWSAALVMLAAATDAVDGTVARWLRHRGATRPDIGGWLDPLVDKLFVVIVLATIWWHTRDTLLIATIAAREILFAPLALIYLVRRGSHSELKARTIGKVATIAQFLACAVAVVDPHYAWPLAAIAAILGLAAIIDYALHMRDAELATPAAT